ncbi:helix-turn-helix domain-containing protein [Streptococcus ferus]|uniref:helix-turn-helix domain-containing protein n=1 Tax=Streptococcus ferus TaxID=1345 RepID=UPI002353D27E|nr:helix-turn-helix domain-containing protein [Streptococcus ferus]
MFPERLKSLRLEAGLTQKELAEKTQMSQPQYARTENGGRKPSSETLEKFATFFNVSTDYLLGNTNIKNPNIEIDKEELKESLRHSLGYTGQPPTEEEVENMANAFLEYIANKKS